MTDRQRYDEVYGPLIDKRGETRSEVQKFDLQNRLEEPITPPSPEQVRAARINAAESAIAGEWEDDLADVLAMLGLDQDPEGADDS